MRLAKPLLLFLICWFVPSLLLSLPIFSFVPKGYLGDIIVAVCMSLYFLLALSLSFRVIKSVLANTHTPPRVYALVIASLIWCFLYLITRGEDTTGVHFSILGTCNLLIFATLAGSMLSSAVKRVGELFPICVTAAIADIVSVYFGPSKEIATSLGNYYESGLVGPPPLSDFIIVKMMIPGYAFPVPLFGVTDWILVVLLSSALLRIGKSDNVLRMQGKIKEHVYLPISGCGLMGSVFLAQFTGVFLPALPIISLLFLSFVILKYRDVFTLQRSDLLLSIIFPILVASTIILTFR